MERGWTMIYSFTEEMWRIWNRHVIWDSRLFSKICVAFKLLSWKNIFSRIIFYRKWGHVIGALSSQDINHNLITKISRKSNQILYFFFL